VPKFDSYKTVSNYLLAVANETGTFVSNLKLQKLMYYFQAWFYSGFDEPLFEEDFQAWVHGPVIPKLYQDYKSFGYKPIVEEGLGDKEIDTFLSSLTDEQRDFMSQVEEFYFSKTGYELERMSHNEEPWTIARKGIPEDEPSEEVITLDTMKSFYEPYINE